MERISITLNKSDLVILDFIKQVYDDDTRSKAIRRLISRIGLEKAAELTDTSQEDILAALGVE